MEVTRRDLITLVGVAATAGFASRALADASDAPERLLEFEPLGNVTLLHVTDTHATLLPVHVRPPDRLRAAAVRDGRRLARALRHQPGVAAGPRADPGRLSGLGGPIWPDGRIRAPGRAGQAGARRAARPHAAARRRRHLAGVGHGVVEPRR